MAGPSGTQEVGGILGPGTALLHPLPPAPGVPAVGPEKFSKLSRCRARPTRNRGKVVSSHLEAAGRGWRWVPRAAGARTASSPKRRSGCGARSLAQAQSRACRQPAAAGEWGAEPGCRREETGGGGRRRGGAGCGWVEGRRAEDWGLQPPRVLPPPRRPRAPAPFPGLLEPGSEGLRIWGLRNAGKDAYGSGRVRVRVEQGRCAGATAGTERTSLLQTAGLGPSPGA